MTTLLRCFPRILAIHTQHSVLLSLQFDVLYIFCRMFPRAPHLQRQQQRSLHERSYNVRRTVLYPRQVSALHYHTFTGHLCGAVLYTFTRNSFCIKLQVCRQPSVEGETLCVCCHAMLPFIWTALSRSTLHRLSTLMSSTRHRARF